MCKFRAFLCLLACAVLFSQAALAEDCFTVNIDTLDTARLNDDAYVAQNLTAQTQGVRVLKTISDSNELAARVRLTILQTETDAVIFDKNYGFVGGNFDSGTIYLPYVDNNVIPYLITLSVEDVTYAIPFMHLQPRLVNNSGCTYGIRLSEVSPALSGNWLMGTMLDLASLRAQGETTVSVCASNLYTVGQATIAVSGDQLTVSLTFDPNADVELLSSAVYLIGDVTMLSSGDPTNVGQPAYGLGQAIPIEGLDTALLYVPITLSYDSTALTEFTYDSGSAELGAQRALWALNLQANGVQ
jgi:hypothetical protein